MNSLEKMISVLDLFDGTAMEWLPDSMAERLDLPRSTLYRYLKVLTDAGLLTSLPGVGYTLGPRVAELDFRMRLTDPLIAASRPVMAELVQDVPGISLLCRRYRDRVLCVHQEQSVATFRSNYERGRARPLVRGAASRIILAYMPAPVVRRLQESAPATFAEAGLGDNLPTLRAKLKELRQRGYDVTQGDLTSGVTGVAAAIFDARENVLGSLSVTLGESQVSLERLAYVADRVRLCARIVTKTVAREKTQEAVPQEAAQ
jgi:DNA-binding IclR family transcriptional regulator